MEEQNKQTNEKIDSMEERINEPSKKQNEALKENLIKQMNEVGQYQ